MVNGNTAFFADSWHVGCNQIGCPLFMTGARTMSKTAEPLFSLLPSMPRLPVAGTSRRATTGRDEVAASANYRLKCHPQLQGKSRWVKCYVADGCLYLSGRLNSWYLKQMAQEAVRDLEGVDEIVNNIRVTDSLTN